MGSAFGSPLAALLVAAIAARLQTLHDRGRTHGDLGPRTVLVGPGGGIALVAPGLPALRALMVPPEARPVRLRRSAPEALLGRNAGSSGDLYELGALYYQLLSGVSYRRQLDEAALYQAAEAARSPDLPGELPDPRSGLVALLRTCLAPDPRRRVRDAAAFGASVRTELTKAGIALADRSTLARLLEEYVPATTPRGVDALLETADVETAPPVGGVSGWAAVLGHSPHEMADPQQSGAADPTLSRTANAVLVRPLHALSKDRSEARLKLPPAPDPRAPQATDMPSLSSAPGRPPPTLDDAARLPRRTVLALVLGAAAILSALFWVGQARQPVTGQPVTGQPVTGQQVTRPPPERPAQPRVASKSRPGPAPARAPQNPKRASHPRPESLGLVSVMSNPSGATVLIDGGYVGTTPLVLKHDLKPHKVYRITISAEGFEDWQRALRPKNGSLSLVAQLSPRP